jgi:hypothetical protein
MTGPWQLGLTEMVDPVRARHPGLLASAPCWLVGEAVPG